MAPPVPIAAAMVGRTDAPPWDARTRCPDAPTRCLSTRRAATRRPCGVISRRQARVPRPRRPSSSLVALLVAARRLRDAAPAASFDPSGPCTTDGRRPARTRSSRRWSRRATRTRRPRPLDSGRNCTAESLGYPARSRHRRGPLRGRRRGTSAGTGGGARRLQAPGLTADAIAEFYASQRPRGEPDAGSPPSRRRRSPAARPSPRHDDGLATADRRRLAGGRARRRQRRHHQRPARPEDRGRDRRVRRA